MSSQSILDSIVSITITRQTTTVTVASFDTILIAGEFLTTKTTPNFGASERTRSYSTLAAMVSEGWASTDAIYQAAAAVFAQNPSVSSIKVGRKLTGGDGSETWTAALDAINLYDSDWYGIGIVSRTQADQEDLADWAESNKKLAGVSSDDSGIIAATTTDIAAYLDTNNLERTFCVYHNLADGTPATDPYAEFAFLGKLFPKTPGTATWMFKTLSGVAVSASDLTDTQRSNALGKNCNLIVPFGGVDITEEGTVGTGEYIDNIRGTDWLEATIQAAVAQILVNNDKIPYTDAGAAAVQAAISDAIQTGINNGFLAAVNPSNSDLAPFVVTVPAVASVSATDKGNRLLPDVEFTAYIAGAIHKTTIAGVVAI